jgi:hypothetical protein
MVDGGREYLRRGALDWDRFKETSIEEEILCVKCGSSIEAGFDENHKYRVICQNADCRAIQPL